MNTLKKLLAKLSEAWSRIPEKSAALILDWMLVAASLTLVVVIYIPRGIWAEENGAMEETLHRMMVVSKAEEMFHTITGEWATDGEYLFQLMSQAHDTLIGDTTFVGNQTIHVYGQPRHVNIPVGLGYQMDTTFSAPLPVRIVIMDTTYTVVLWDAELSSLDTIYLTGVASLLQFDDDPAFRSIADTAFGSHSEVDNEYTWNRYRLTFDLLSHPVIGERFILNVDSTGSLTIVDPLPPDYYESRYLFFRYRPRNIGRISEGIASWKGQ